MIERLLSPKTSTLSKEDGREATKNKRVRTKKLHEAGALDKYCTLVVQNTLL